MPQENVELVKRMLALFHAGDAEGALAVGVAALDEKGWFLKAGCPALWSLCDQ